MKKSEKELKKYELKICNTVNDIEDSIRNRFKALAVISDQLADVSKKHDDEMLTLEKEADEKDKPLYELRKLIIQGGDFDASNLSIDEFDKRLEEIKDQDYDKIKIQECKNVDTLSTQQGIPDFWLTAIKNNMILKHDIAKRDEKLLHHLIDIEYMRVEGTPDFLLKFHFTPNDYIANTVITKKYIMEENSHCKKIE